MSTETRKQTALEFLRHAREGNRAAAEKLIAPRARHHNAYFPAGFPALLDAMVEAAKAVPDKKFDVKHVLGDGDFVAVHSHMRPKETDPGVAVVHLFRFEGERIAELWDLGQPVPAQSPNADGMF